MKSLTTFRSRSWSSQAASGTSSGREAALMCDDVEDRDIALAVGGELRDEVRHPVVQSYGSITDKVPERRGDHDLRLRKHEPERFIRRIHRRRVDLGMTKGPVPYQFAIPGDGVLRPGVTSLLYVPVDFGIKKREMGSTHPNVLGLR